MNPRRPTIRALTIGFFVVFHCSLACSDPPSSGTVSSDCIASNGFVSADLIRRFVEGTWVLESWNLEEQLRRPPEVRGYETIHDGVMLFTVYRVGDAVTSTRFGNAEYFVRDGEWSYRYDHNNYIEVEDETDKGVTSHRHFKWSEPRRFAASLRDGNLVLANEDGRRVMIFSHDRQTYLEDGETVRTWRRQTEPGH